MSNADPVPGVSLSCDGHLLWVNKGVKLVACPVISGHDPNAPGLPGALGSGSQMGKGDGGLSKDTPGDAA